MYDILIISTLPKRLPDLPHSIHIQFYILFLHTHWVPLVLPVQSWVCGSTWGATQWRKTDLPSPGSCQLPIVLQSGVGFRGHFFLPCRNFCQTCICISLMHAITTIMIHMCGFPVPPRKHSFVIVVHHLQPLESFSLPSPQLFLSLGRRVYDVAITELNGKTPLLKTAYT